jgi:hypothetical protein
MLLEQVEEVEEQVLLLTEHQAQLIHEQEEQAQIEVLLYINCSKILI